MDTQDAYRLLAALSPAGAIEPTRLQGIAAMMATGQKMAVRGRSEAEMVPAGLAVIPIMGGLSHRPSVLSELFGAGDAGTYTGIRRRLNDEVESRSTKRIVLLIDSPGGTVGGLEELAADIRAANRVKPVIAVADTFAASAALWLASQAGEFVATPSAAIGSLGVFLLHLDQSRALDRIGVKPTFLFADVSPFKVETNSLQPLSKEAKAALQTDVDAIGDKFVRDVARGRHVGEALVKSQFGKGRTLLANDALRAGLVDRIATFEQVLTGRSSSSPGRGMAFDAAPSRTSSRERIQQERRSLDALDGRISETAETPAERRRARLEDLR